MAFGFREVGGGFWSGVRRFVRGCEVGGGVVVRIGGGLGGCDGSGGEALGMRGVFLNSVVCAATLGGGDRRVGE